MTTQKPISKSPIPDAFLSKNAEGNYLSNGCFCAGCGNNTSFIFTGKEKDSETGYSYFGARYLDNELMTCWLSVDPMADKYPSISPYAYCAWNPVKLVDPDGEKIKGVTYNEDTGEYTYTEESKKNGVDKYISVRIQTRGGRKSIEKMIKDKREFNICIVDNPLFIEENGIFFQLNGITIDNNIIISTCLEKREGEVDDAMIVRTDNKISYGTIFASKKNLNFKSKDPKIIAFFKSGLYAFNIENPYRDQEELINGVGAHEEAHLFQRKEIRLDDYCSEYDAYRKEMKSRKEYLKLHPK